MMHATQQQTEGRLAFVRYQRGEWETLPALDPDHPATRHFRQHHLAWCWTGQTVAPHLFAPLMTTSSTPFLDCGPGLLVCVRVLVTKGYSEWRGEELDGPYPFRVPVLLYTLEESAGRPWNDYWLPADGGRWQRSTRRVLPDFDLAAFFGGATEFPLSPGLPDDPGA